MGRKERMHEYSWNFPKLASGCWGSGLDFVVGVLLSPLEKKEKEKKKRKEKKKEKKNKKEKVKGEKDKRRKEKKTEQNEKKEPIAESWLLRALVAGPFCWLVLLLLLLLTVSCH